jgi:DNA-directed RNA polymerase specialized sigma subunit
MHDIFNTKPGSESLPLEQEWYLIAQAQAGVPYSAAAQWDLLRQYRGLLQKTANDVRRRVRGMKPEQIEDLQSDLLLAALDAIQAFDFAQNVRLVQTLPAVLSRAAAEVTTALTIPNGTLALWFKVWRAGEQDHDRAAQLAPSMGMASDTYVAIKQAMHYAETDWDQPYTAGRPVADTVTYELAHKGLDLLRPHEREVIELAYGFRGLPKADSEVADIVEVPRNTVKFQRTRALDKMRRGLTKETA